MAQAKHSEGSNKRHVAGLQRVRMQLWPARSWILWVFGLLVFMLLGDRIIGYYLARVFFSTHFRYADLYEGRLPAQVLVVGNSRGVHSYNRSELERLGDTTMANISFNALPAKLLPAIVGDYFDHHEAPRHLWIEVTLTATRPKAGSMERFKILMNSSKRISKVLAEERFSEYCGARMSALYRCNTRLFWRSLYFRTNSDQNWAMKQRITEDMQDRIEKIDLVPFVRDEGYAKALIEAIATAESHNTEVTLMCAPYLPAYAQKSTEIQDWIRWMEQRVGHKIHDFSNAVKDSQMFADRVHLNVDGGKAFARTLVRDVLNAH